MKTKNYISFHIGRGGSFNNQGHLSFSGEEDFQDLIRVHEEINGWPYTLFIAHIERN